MQIQNAAANLDGTINDRSAERELHVHTGMEERKGNEVIDVSKLPSNSVRFDLFLFNSLEVKRDSFFD